MKVRIDYYCKSKTRRDEVEDISIDIDIPFIPIVGMFLKVTPHGDYLEVKSVHFDISDGGEGLVIGVDNEPLWSWEAMEAEGWRTGE